MITDSALAIVFCFTSVRPYHSQMRDDKGPSIYDVHTEATFVAFSGLSLNSNSSLIQNVLNSDHTYSESLKALFM